MQKSKKATLVIILVIFFWGILSNFNLLFQHNKLYLYIANPIFWICMAVLLRIGIGRNFERSKLKKEILQYTIITVLVYILIYMLSGLVLTFGKNPYATNLSGILTNFWLLGVKIIAQEYIRYMLIHNVYKKDEKLIAILLGIVYTIINLEFIRYTYVTITVIYIIKEVFQRVIPTIVKNILFSYMAINSGYKIAITYELLTQLFLWVTPIFPKTPWIMSAMIETVIPLILLLYIKYLKDKKDMIRFREREFKEENPGRVIPIVVIIILLIWFVIGIFPIKPVAIASGSMENEISIGDVVIIKKCYSNDIAEGDIIEYKMDGHTVVHRVIEKVQKQGDFYFITKGDNNDDVDGREVTEEQLIGKVIFKIKYIGYPAILLNQLANR